MCLDNFLDVVVSPFDRDPSILLCIFRRKRGASNCNVNGRLDLKRKFISINTQTDTERHTKDISVKCVWGDLPMHLLHLNWTKFKYIYL